MCLHGALCSILVNLICNMTTFRKKNVLTFDPTLGVEGVCKDRICAKKKKDYTLKCSPDTESQAGRSP